MPERLALKYQLASRLDEHAPAKWIFRLAEQSGDWLVYDVVIDGASIVGNYRAQFARIIRDTSYAGLVGQMQQRGLVVKVFEKTTPAITLSSMHTVAAP